MGMKLGLSHQGKNVGCGRCITTRKGRCFGGLKCASYGGEKKKYRILVGKLEWKRPLERPRHRGDYTIKIVNK